MAEPNDFIRRQTHAELRSERTKWFESLDIPNKNERLFELELYLKALDRFCNVRNHPIGEIEHLVGRDFSAETKILVSLLNKILNSISELLPDRQSSAFHFQSFLESRLLSDHARMEWLEKSLRQDSPEESLYVLKYAMTSLREIVSGMTLLKGVSYPMFHHIGHMISREIAWNSYFNPFHVGEFTPVHDKIRNQAIMRVVKKNVPPELRREISLVFLLIFRYLRYVSFVKEDNPDLATAKDNIPIFSLLRSELLTMVDYLERELPSIIRNKPGLNGRFAESLALFDGLAFQIQMEIKKTFQLELKDAVAITEMGKLSTAIARAKGVLVEILRQTAVQLTQILDPSVEGRHVFRDFISRTELSLKLRKDIWIFHKVVDNIDKTIEKKLPGEDFKPIIEALKSLRNYVFYFQNVSFQMVRYTDREGFTEFFRQVDSFPLEELYQKEKLELFHRIIHTFVIFLETTISNLSHRSELKDLPFGTREGEFILEQFLR